MWQGTPIDVDIVKRNKFSILKLTSREMAKYFSEGDIEEFRDCFFLFAKQKQIVNVQELTITMRSLGFSPTIVEVTNYYKNKQRDGRIDFATFLDIMHEHSEREKCEQEITAAFQSHDRQKQGSIPGEHLMHVLTKFGEKLSEKEVSQLFRDAGVQVRGNIPYDNILRTMLTPIPDY